jgi:hypothetical protein
MRVKSGKGLIVAFDRDLEKRLEELRAKRGYYPMLKTIGESYDPPHGACFIDRALRRLSQAGRLSDEANLVYNSKTKQKGKKNEIGQSNTKKITKAKK